MGVNEEVRARFDDALIKITEMSKDIKYIKERFEGDIKTLTCHQEEQVKKNQLLDKRILELEYTNRILKWIAGIVTAIIIMISSNFIKK